MTQLRNKQSGELRQASEVERDIRQHTSAPAAINFDEFGWDVVFPAPHPVFDPITQYVRQLDPVLTAKGTWEQVWGVIDLDAETIAANQLRHKTENNTRIWANIASLEREQMMPRHLRDLITDGHPAKAKVDAVNAEIAALKAELL